MSPPDNPDSQTSPPSGGGKSVGFFSIFPSIMLPMFIAVVDQTIIATALPAIVANMGQVERASWVVVSYLVAATIAAPIYGRLGDAFGLRKMMIIGLTIFIVSSILCSLSTSMEMLTISRVLQGLGGGGLMTLSQALVGQTIPPRERARYQGYLASVAVCANSFGPIAGGYLTEHFGWRSIFFVNIPIGIAAMVLTTRLPKAPAERAPWSADFGGVVLVAIFVATTLFSLEQIQHMKFDALPVALALFAAGLVSLGLLLWHERRTPSPLVPLALLRQGAIWRSDAMAACHGAALVALITFVPVYLQVVRGLSPSETGLVLVPLTIGIGVGSLVTGRLVSRTGKTAIFPVGGLSVTTLLLLGLAFAAKHLSVVWLSTVLAAIGLFMGTVMAVVQVTVQSAAGKTRLGEAAASVQFSRSIGAGFGTALAAATLFGYLALSNPQAAAAFAALVESHGRAVVTVSAQIASDIEASFRAAFLLMAAFTAVGVVLAATNPLRRI